jgi:hypothetical protein
VEKRQAEGIFLFLKLCKMMLMKMSIAIFQKFPDLKFKYVEEDRPEEFFIPYVWSLVCQASGIHWNMDKVKLFFPESSEVAC